MAASTPEPPVGVELRPLTAADAEAHCAGEDELTVRWLTGGYGDVAGTIAYFQWLADNEAAGAGKRGYGVWLGDLLAGYVDVDPELGGDLGPGEVNLSYAVHPWARGRGVAVAAVLLICDRLREQAIGQRAVIRVEPENVASVRVAEKAGFHLEREIASATDVHADGSPKTLRVYLLDL
jgi:RimJ/RimL family protein N-acetyltransferase